MPELTAHGVIERLDLSAHPEGGHFREIFRSSAFVTHPAGAAVGTRAAMTSIYFLLAADEFSAWHRVRSDETWCLLAGGPLELHRLQPSGGYRPIVLGTALDAGEEPQAVVRAGWWQAARPARGAPFALCACIVAPGFDFADFELASREELTSRYPAHADVVARFTR